jgi:hypothetical protein
LVQRPPRRPRRRRRPASPRGSARAGFASRRQRASSEQQRSKGGFPIRKFTDQSLFAAPRDLSQRTTSFIASQRQGIHRTPLRHLIALIAKARSSEPRRSAIGGRTLSSVEKTSFASNASGNPSGQAPDPRLVARCGRIAAKRFPPPDALSSIRRRRLAKIRPSTECASSSQCQIASGESPRARAHSPASRPSARQTPRRVTAPRAKPMKSHRKDIEAPPPPNRWWSQTGSNRRPHACKARALPTELWPRHHRDMVGLGGLEPPTSRLSSARSNQLSYKPAPEDRGRRPGERPFPFARASVVRYPG